MNNTIEKSNIILLEKRHLILSCHNISIILVVNKYWNNNILLNKDIEDIE